MSNQAVIFTHGLGYVERQGRILKLKKTHDINCKLTHNITYRHDPVADVLLNRCIFNFIVKHVKRSRLFTYCHNH